MATLRELFDGHRGQLVAKIDHFFDDYEPFLAPIRREGVRVLEIGVDGGGSLELWQAYFGPTASIHGIDIDPAARGRCPPGAAVHTGSQDDPDFLLGIVDAFGPFDLVIDDGSHQVGHQILTFETLYPTMTDDGVYICEDSFTSYWPVYGGGLRRSGTFVEYAKDKVDELHAWWFDDATSPPTDFTATTAGITMLSGATVFRRGARRPPRYVIRRGELHDDMSVDRLHRAAMTNLDPSGS